jgi:hypothetical protein
MVDRRWQADTRGSCRFIIALSMAAFFVKIIEIYSKKLYNTLK